MCRCKSWCVISVFMCVFLYLFNILSTNCARRSLDWLPVKQRIQFKNLLLIYKSSHTGLPSYFNSALVPFSSPFRSTRCSSPANLILSTMTCNSSLTPKSQLNYSFDYMAPRNWNSLPDIVRLAPSVPAFRKRLKTYLFCKPFLLHRYTFLIGWFSWIMTYFTIYDYSILDAP